MLKKISRFFYKNYFDITLPLEYRLYMIFFIESYVISLISATTNTLLGKGLVGVVLQWAYIVVCTVVLFVPLNLRMKLSKPLLLYMAFVYIPLLFFQTAGYYGTALMFSLLVIFLLSIVFKGKQRAWLVTLNILTCLGCCLMQYFHPNLVTPHATELDKLIDFLVALFLSAVGLGIMTVYVSNAFDIERFRIRKLLRKLEQTNESLSELTNRDALTGVYNRRYLTQFLSKSLEARAKTGSNLCLLC
ncbi:GGDEF domain-containing protein, partial [Porphyromonadaceae bacterium OttesenSCG-928-L07]|nr:GGDEF domain-containing protein [Porphyromonadaceae bacterium OttesenSCG-928-L07]